MISATRSVCLLTALLMTASCGFHLRGTMDEDFALDRVRVEAVNTYGDLQRELEARLQRAGANLAGDGESAWTLALLEERTYRRPVTVSSRNSASEYELRLSTIFALDDASGTEIITPTRLEAERTYSFDRTSLVGNTEEEELLLAEMRAELAERLMRRIDVTLENAGTVTP